MTVFLVLFARTMHHAMENIALYIVFIASDCTRLNGGN